MKGPACKPQFLVCYLCGQQFGTASLAIHQPQCYEKKTKQWKAGDPATRGPKPKDPAKMGSGGGGGGGGKVNIDEFNDQQFKQFTDNMAQCENCGRKFLPDRLVVHQRSCKPGAAGASRPVPGKENEVRPPTGAGGGGGGRPPSSSPARPRTSGDPSRPKGIKPSFLVCYLCGQQFGTASLSIHIPQCYEKKTKQWKAGDPETRGPRPKNPETLPNGGVPTGSGPDGKVSIDEFNDQQFKQFTDNMVQCENCGRKFLPDRLVVHQRSCKAGAAGASRPIRGKEVEESRPGTQGMRPPGGGGGGGGGRAPGSSPARPRTSGDPSRPKGIKPSFLVCYLCGQQFGTSSLSIHIPQCYEKKTKQWRAGDPATRGPKPKDPDTLPNGGVPTGSGPDGKVSIDEFNDQQFKQFTDNMVQCENCGRKFLPDRLVVHQRSCKPGAAGASRPVQRRETPEPARPKSHAGITGGGGGLSPAPGRLNSTTPSKTPDVSPPRAQGVTPKVKAMQRLVAQDIEEGEEEFIDVDSVRARVRTMDRDCTDDDVDALLQSLDLRGGRVPRTAWLESQRGRSKAAIDPRKRRLPTGDMGEARECTSCGVTEHDATARFCSGCGTAFGAAPSTPPEGVTCACGAMVPEGKKFCSSCGTAVPEAESAECGSCGAALDAGAKFCDSCGEAVGGEVPAAEPEMLCVECGEVFAPGSKFCEECGTQLVTLTPENMARGDAAGPDDDDKEEEEGEEPQTPAALDETSNGAGSPSAGRSPGGGSGWAKQSRVQLAEVPETVKVEPGPVAGEEYGDVGPRVECTFCGRRFAQESVAKHEAVCERITSKKRKVFDSSKTRTSGTELASFQGTANRDKLRAKKDDGKASWRSKSEDFRKAMRAAREVDKVLASGGTAKDLPPPSYSENPDYVACPYCGRRFNQTAAERHIPRCKDTVNKPKPPPKLRRR